MLTPVYKRPGLWSHYHWYFAPPSGMDGGFW